MDIGQEMLLTFNTVPELLKEVISGDESWVYRYDIVAKTQSSRFVTIEEMKEKSKQELIAMPKSEF